MAPSRPKLEPAPLFDRRLLLAFLTERLPRDKAERHAGAVWRAAAAAGVAAPAAGGSGGWAWLERVAGLPAWVREELPRRFALTTSRVARASSSASGDTTKLVVELADGHRVEAVVMRHAKGRTTLCVSSQVGCKMGCAFCATGTLGELGNLHGGEVVEQLVHARALGVDVRNVVFMGMGEPLNNYDAVLDAYTMLTDRRVFALSPARVTVSTVGVVGRMRQLVRDMPGVSLALSLHAPNQALRERIVPTARAFPLPKILAALDEYLGQKPDGSMKTMIEYCVLRGVNDSEECARELGELLGTRNVIVNLIPWNPAESSMPFEPPEPSAVQRMVDVLTAEPYKLFTTVRHEMGADIAGACGQLALVDRKANVKAVASREQESSTAPGTPTGRPLADIEDLCSGTGPARAHATPSSSPTRGKIPSPGPAPRATETTRGPDPDTVRVHALLRAVWEVLYYYYDRVVSAVERAIGIPLASPARWRC